ncbi:purine-nucleoside phosphorylase [Sporosalibacterium faouarense]|uniref:purine-nucleoside phosphorylase n=1 Tax=Sporosalibacterium faouarense TaxID=516123 RepID=UPI00141D4FDA|nr:purine-nucleoside phosphorylase [Sporosalibacterium faouarense]MTI48172.1 purine-nucleoside phosphorylase [Bacillota bacterium]
MANLLEKIIETSSYIEKITDFKPEIGLILGSGLGTLADEIENPIKIEYEDIPNFPISTVEGHEGRLVLGTLEGKKVIAMQGRFHYYEGYSMKEITFPVRVMKALGVEMLLVTNACGGMDKKLYPGALMIIEDHINFTGDNPLIGRNFEELGPRFPDMSTAYDRDLVKLAHSVGDKLDIKTEQGIYAAISGPYYFSKAELRMLRNIGGDAIGMSTVPEVIVAKHTGLKVLGISCVTDMAIADEIESISHEEVIAVANETRPKFIKLVKGILSEVNL